MDVQASKIELAKIILGLENPELIQRITDLLDAELNEKVSLSEQEEFEIRLGLSQLDKGQRVSFDDFMSQVS